jgi:hypothetical protein
MKLKSLFRRQHPFVILPPPASKATLSPKQQAVHNYDRMHRADLLRERRSIDNR